MSVHVLIAGAQYLKEATQGGIIYLTHGFREFIHSLCSVASGPRVRENIGAGACGYVEEMAAHLVCEREIWGGGSYLQIFQHNDQLSLLRKLSLRKGEQMSQGHTVGK